MYNLTLIYKIYLRLPYILTVIFFLLSIYHLIRKDTENFIQSLISTGFGVLATISYLICFNLILPNLVSTDFRGPFSSVSRFINNGFEIWCNLLIVAFLLLGIVDYDNISIYDRLKYPIMPIIFLGVFLVLDKITLIL